MNEDKPRRVLTTILAADVVGYSALMSSDEEATLATLRAYRLVIDALIDKHGGRIFNTAGDAVLAEFGSAVEAVRCAISMQEDVAIRNAQLPEAGQMWFRVGINIGDVIEENGDLFGDGVNVAARLEGLADKGGICISGSTFEQVKNKISFAFDDLGGQIVKNIPEPVSAFRLMPGQVSVNNNTLSETAGAGPAVGPAAKKWVLLAAGAVVVMAAAAFLTGLLPSLLQDGSAYDGKWKVTLSAITGCRNNETRAYMVNVAGGKIDEKAHRFPKSGQISADGAFSIGIYNRSGILRGEQTGRITGDTGKGEMIGADPRCSGTVVIARMK